MTKRQVRAIAAERGFAVATKPDSHDICFIPDGDTRGFLTRRLGARPGPIVDAATGATVGEHRGAYGFTVGQRRGLGVSVGDQRPRYVLGIEPVSRTVTIGTAEQAGVGELHTAPPTWTGGPPGLPLRAEVQLRAHGAAVPCEVGPGADGGLRIVLGTAQRGVAPGQSAVLYVPDPERGDLVLGQGRVTATAP
jgi:tRNA-specific 2-thiouridylase